MKLRRNSINQFDTVGVESRRGPVKLIGLCFLISGFIALLYLNSLGNQFTNWDDGMIYQNPNIRGLSWEKVKKISTLEKGNTYQPIRMLSYAVDYHFWKLNPTGYHITNILLYILTCIIVFLSLRLLSEHLREKANKDSHFRVALFGSMVFAAHPVHVEAVTWLAARKEVLQGFFFFLAFYLYVKGRGGEDKKRIIYLGLILFYFLFAILSKPSAVVFPAVVLVYEIAFIEKKWIEFIKKHGLFFAFSISISLIFTFILLKVMFDAGGIKPYHGGTLFNNLLTSFYVFLYNMKLLIFTINYSAAYTIPVPNPIWSIKTAIIIGVVLLLFILSFWSLKRTKVIFFAFFFFVVTIFPYLNIIPISTLLADRYVFIASFSYCFLLGIVFDKFYLFKPQRFSKEFFKLLSIALFLFILIAYSLMTMRQNTIWENSYTLWADAVEKAPESNTANALMGAVYLNMGMDEKAAKYLEKAIQILPADHYSRNNLGIVYGRLGQSEKALREFLIAIQLEPEGYFAKWNLALFYHQQKKYKNAEEIYKFLIEKTPGDGQLHFQLGLLWKDMGCIEESVSELLKAIELAPSIINPYEELGSLYLSRVKDVEKAIYFYRKGIEAAPKATERVEQLRWMIQDLEGHR